MGMDFGNGIDGNDGDKEAKMSKNKRAALLISSGPEGMEIFYNFGVNVADIRYENLVTIFEEHFAKGG